MLVFLGSVKPSRSSQHLMARFPNVHIQSGWFPLAFRLENTKLFDAFGVEIYCKAVIFKGSINWAQKSISNFFTNIFWAKVP